MERVISFFFRLVIRVAFRLLVALLPYAWRLLMVVVEMVQLTVLSLITGFSTTTQRLSTLWEKRLIDGGVPLKVVLSLRLQYLAIGFVGMSWIITLYLFYLGIRLLFNF